MKPSEVRDAINLCIRADSPFLIHGSFGIGKSDIVKQVAADNGLELIDLRLSQLESVDLRGTPKVVDGRTVWNPPAELPGPDSHPSLLFLDELTSATAEVQAAAYQLVLDRKLGTYELPPNCRIGAAGNRITDASIVNKMSAALKNRFWHGEMEVDLQDWCDWAIKNDVHDDVLSFIRFRPAMLDETLKRSETKAEEDRVRNVLMGNGIGKPRSWHRVSEKLKVGIPPSLEFKIVEGDVGEACAVEFVSFRKIVKHAPNPDTILLSPMTAPVPTEPAILYAVATALSRRCTSNNFEQLAIYGDRLPAEFTALLIKDAFRTCPAISASPAFTKWAVKNQDLLM